MKIGVIGTGLIGGSILKSLEYKDFELVGINLDDDLICPIEERTYKITQDLRALAGSEVIFIALDISRTLDILEELKNFIPSDCIVSDTTEVKNVFKDKNYPFNFISGHPLVEITLQGFQNSSNMLFQDKKWIITKQNNTLMNILTQIGANPVVMDIDEHDRLLAYSSHLPVLISQNLANTTKKPEILKIAADALKDTSKYVSYNEKNASDILKYNKANISQALADFKSSFSELFQDDSYFENIKTLKKEYEKTTGEIARKEKFESIFKKNFWGDTESLSGPASSLESSKHLREVLPKLIEYKGIKTVADIPCGDMNWFSTIPIELEYFGFDIVSELIERNKEKFKDKPNFHFETKDALTQELPQVDLILCRDLIIHFPLAAIYDLLQNFIKSKSKYLLITQHTILDHTCINNMDIDFGEFAFRNLTQPPFNLPYPELLIPEDSCDLRCERYMALFELETIDKFLNS